MSNDRLAYIRRRKEFLNQKSFDVFEKYQIFIFLYIGYIITIITQSKTKKLDHKDVVNLYQASLSFVFLFFSVFLIFQIIIILNWLGYEKEENETDPLMPAHLAEKKGILFVLGWVEVWVILAGIIETAALILVSNHTIYNF